MNLETKEKLFWQGKDHATTSIEVKIPIRNFAFFDYRYGFEKHDAVFKTYAHPLNEDDAPNEEYLPLLLSDIQENYPYVVIHFVDVAAKDSSLFVFQNRNPNALLAKVKKKIQQQTKYEIVVEYGKEYQLGRELEEFTKSLVTARKT